MLHMSHMAHQNGPDEPKHPIGVVAERTGLSQDVLRAWERRYGLARPARSAGGQRLYSDADLEHLRLLSQAILGGRSIGRIAHLPLDELAALVQDDAEARRRRPRDAEVQARDDHVARAFEQVAALDGLALDALLRRSAAMLGAATFLDSVAAPLLRRVGEAWHAGDISPAQEHLATAVVKRVIDAVMHALPMSPASPVMISCTPAGERHEIGALLAAATAAVMGWQVVYLGADLPASDIAAAAERTQAHVVALSLVYASDSAAVARELRALRAALPQRTRLVVGGAAAAPILEDLRAADITYLEDLAALREELASRPGAKA